MKPCFTPFLLVAMTGTLATAQENQKNFQFFGVNEAGAEFGATVPGIQDEDFTFPNKSAISVLMGRGLTSFRIPFLMERLAPDGIDQPFSEAYLEDLVDIVDHITGKEERTDVYAILDSHNYGRYHDEIITDLVAFKAYHRRMAEVFLENDHVVFDCNNEPYEMGEDENVLVPNLMQACIDGVREAGAVTQYIFVQGTSWSGAHSWYDSGNADSMGNLTDPMDMTIIEMHQYLDEDSSGTHEECVSGTIGAERMVEATEWLRENRKFGILGEYAGADNDVCKEAVRTLHEYMVENKDVWLGTLWWAAGPYWGDYLFSIEPETGIALEYLDIITAFA